MQKITRDFLCLVVVLLSSLCLGLSLSFIFFDLACFLRLLARSRKRARAFQRAPQRLSRARDRARSAASCEPPRGSYDGSHATPAGVHVTRRVRTFVLAARAAFERRSSLFSEHELRLAQFARSVGVRSPCGA